MKKNEHISEQLSAYLDGQLDDAQKQAVEAALAHDEALARELEALRATQRLLRSLPQSKAPEDFVAGVLAQAERLHLTGMQAPAASRSAGSLRWLATAAVLALAACIGVVTFLALSNDGQSTDRLTLSDGKALPPMPAARQQASELQEAPAQLAMADETKAHAEYRAREVQASRMVAKDSVADGTIVNGGALMAAGRGEALSNVGELTAGGDLLAASPLPDEIVIYADDPDVAARQVAAILESNAIAVSEADSDMAQAGYRTYPFGGGRQMYAVKASSGQIEQVRQAVEASLSPDVPKELATASESKRRAAKLMRNADVADASRSEQSIAEPASERLAGAPVASSDEQRQLSQIAIAANRAPLPAAERSAPSALPAPTSASDDNDPLAGIPVDRPLAHIDLSGTTTTGPQSRPSSAPAPTSQKAMASLTITIRPSAASASRPQDVP